MKEKERPRRKERPEKGFKFFEEMTKKQQIAELKKRIELWTKYVENNREKDLYEGGDSAKKYLRRLKAHLKKLQ